MPGIAGIIREQPSEETEQDLGRMVESMRHEADYVGGRYVNREMGLYMGWLAHPFSLGERMPLVSRDKRVVIIVVGEHYPDLWRPISQNGDGVLDANVRDLLRFYEDSPDKFLESLNGWFCGVAVDLNLRRVTLFNDRYGMSRVYFHEGKEEFIFASEAKSLLRIRQPLRAIEPESLAESLRFNCVTKNKSLYKGVSVLPAGSSWDFTGNATPKKKNYFDVADWEKQPTLMHDEFCEKFDKTVSRVIPGYMEGPAPVALSLTAGLDTRVILASVGDDRGTLPCYTFGGLWGETFDIQTARQLAAVCNEHHEVIKINEQFLKDFASFAQKCIYLSDGIHDAFGAHDVYFNEIARKIAPIRLTGKFGSEVVRTRKLIHSTDFPHDLLQPWFRASVDAVPSFDRVSQNAHPLSRTILEEIPWYEFGRVAVEQSKVTLRTPYMDNRLVKLMYQAPRGLRVSRELQVSYIKKRNRELGNIPTDMGRMGREDDAMSKVAHGFSKVMAKSEYIYLYTMPHWLTRVDRKLEKLRLERLLVGKHKFEVYRVWIKTHLADSIRDILLNPRAHCTDFFDKASVARVVEGHTAGTHNYLREINKMLTLELIYSSLLGA